MMTKTQYLLVKLAEEASELSQIALKTSQFGVHEKYIKAEKDNIGRVEQEFNDVLGVIELLKQEVDVVIREDSDQVVAKMVKVKKYMKLSQRLGMVEE